MLGLQPPPASDENDGEEKRGLHFARFRGRKHWIDLSKDTQFTDAWILIALILLGFGLLLRNSFFTTAALLILVLVGVAWLWSSLSLYGVEYRRIFAEKRAFLGEEIKLTLELRNRKFLPLTWLTIHDGFPASLPFDERPVTVNQATNRGEFYTFWMPNAFQRLTRSYTIACTERGYHRFGPARLETGDGFGFFSRQAQLPLEEFFIVYPRLYSVAELNLPSKNPFGGQRAKGHLFEDPMRTVGVRNWQPGDSVRRVHWKATARHRDLLSRVYEPSREQQILLFLNIATLERHWHGTIPDLLERVISVAASLAAVAAENRLPVGLIANGTLPESDQPLRLLPGRSPHQLTRILELLAAVTPFASGQIEKLLMQEAPRLAWGATIVAVTAIAHPELLAALLELAEAGRPVVLFTLAERPPEEHLPGITIYHLPHLIDDLILPELIGPDGQSAGVSSREELAEAQFRPRR